MRRIRLAFAYKNFAAHRGISHIGLGVTALTNTKYFQQHGIRAEVWPVTNNIDIVNRIKGTVSTNDPITHLVIQAPWVSTYDLTTMVHAYPNIMFAVVSHSNVGFLQADPNGVRLLREAGELSMGVHNFKLAGNSERFVETWEHAFRVPMTWLPNLYYIDQVERPPKRWHPGSVLRIGCFGALRPLKNGMTAAAAALQLSSILQADIELYFSGGRTEGGGEVMWRAINQMFTNIPHATLKQAQWAAWPQFRETVRHMHLLLQPSYTESFNMVTADGVAAGVPSVVSEAIDWVPNFWKAHHDDASEIARVGARLLRFQPFSIWAGRAALHLHNRRGFKSWRRFLEHRPS